LSRNRAIAMKVMLTTEFLSRDGHSRASARSHAGEGNGLCQPWCSPSTTLCRANRPQLPPFCDARVSAVGGFGRGVFRCPLNVVEADAAPVVGLALPRNLAMLETHPCASLEGRIVQPCSRRPDHALEG
jgi:hypothetical protein